MPISPPSLADLDYDRLVREVLARRSAHTAEWSDPQPGDPGVTLVELFAWLVDTLLYRANLIPEKQRYAFLRLLGEQVRPAVSASGMIAVEHDDDRATGAVDLAPLAAVDGPVPFETLSELTVLPIQAEAYSKRPLSAAERQQLGGVLAGLSQVYGLGSRRAAGYVTTPVFPQGAADPAGFDLIEDTLDRSLWLALLAGDAEPKTIDKVRQTLSGDGVQRRLLSLGLVPAMAMPEALADLPERARVPYVWEITTGRQVDGRTEMLALDVVEDGTGGLTRPGIQRLALPGPDDLGAPDDGVLTAGVGAAPPRLDDPERAARLVAWLRLRPTIR
ncbi:MAG: putative baseplate assembly protein, partial [bacterium]|nr:putative baseplate assembly protein [bacterium]